MRMLRISTNSVNFKLYMRRTLWWVVNASLIFPFMFYIFTKKRKIQFLLDVNSHVLPAYNPSAVRRTPVHDDDRVVTLIRYEYIYVAKAYPLSMIT